MSTKKRTQSPKNAKDAEISRYFRPCNVRDTNTFKTGYGNKYDNPRSSKKIINDLMGAPTYQSTVFAHCKEPSESIKKANKSEFEPKYKHMSDAYTTKQMFFTSNAPTHDKQFQRIQKPLDNGITSSGDAEHIKQRCLQGHFGGEDAYSIHERIQDVQGNERVIINKNESTRNNEEILMPSAVSLNDYQYLTKIDPKYDPRSAIQNSFGSHIPLHQDPASKTDWVRKTNIESDFLNDNDRKNREADHNYSNIFNNQGSLGPRGNVTLHGSKSVNNIANHEFLGSTSGMQKRDTSNGDMFLSSRENTLWNTLSGDRPKDYKVTTAYRDDTKNTRENYKSVRQLKNDAYTTSAQNSQLFTCNGLANEGAFNKYKKPAKTIESNIAKINVLNAQNLDPITLKREIARKGFQIMEVDKHLDNITGASDGFAEIKVKIPADKNYNDIEKAVSEFGLNLEKPRDQAQVDRNFSTVWMHGGTSMVKETADHGFRHGFIQSDARQKRHIEMRSNGDLFGMSS